MLIDSEGLTQCGPNEVIPASGVHTPYYAAPEQLGADGLGPRRCHASDVYSLGSSARALLEDMMRVAVDHNLPVVATMLGAASGPAARLLAFASECMACQADLRPTAAAAYQLICEAQ